MIRNVVMVRLKPGFDRGRVTELMEGFLGLDCPGTVSYTVGLDAGLRAGNWDMAIVADFTDPDAYGAYDADAEHNRLRGQLGPLAEEVARCQFVVQNPAAGAEGSR